MNKKMQRNPFLDKIIDDVITPTHSFSFDGYHTPKTAEDAKPIIEEYKEGLRKYKEFYEDLENKKRFVTIYYVLSLYITKEEDECGHAKADSDRRR